MTTSTAMGPRFLPLSPRMDKQSRSKWPLILVNDGTPPEIINYQTLIRSVLLSNSCGKISRRFMWKNSLPEPTNLSELKAKEEQMLRYLYWNWFVHHHWMTTRTENRNSSDPDTGLSDPPMKPFATNEQSRSPKILGFHHPPSAMPLSIPLVLVREF